MTLDPTTEIISRFIGLFGLASEEARLRLSYQDFARASADQQGRGPLPATATPDPRAQRLEDYDPHVRLAPLQKHEAGSTASVTAGHPGAESGPASHGHATAPVRHGPAAPAAGEARHPVSEAPGSFATVSVQHLVLEDNDVVSMMGPPGAFLPVPALAAQLGVMVSVAQSLAGFEADTRPAEPGAWAEAGLDLIARIGAASDPGVAGAAVDQLRGPEAVGVVVDGSAADEMPAFRDSLPEALKARFPAPADDDVEDEDEDDGGGETASGEGAEAGSAEAGDGVAVPAGGDAAGAQDDDGADPAAATAPGGSPGPAVAAAPDAPAGDAGPAADDARSDPAIVELIGDANPWAVEPGLTLISGENLAINEATVVVRPVDAPVILVGGDYIDAIGISQVNVISDHDGGALFGGAASRSINAAEITVTAAPVVTAGGPAPGWAVTEITGDLLIYNSIVQKTFVSDFDQISVTWSTTSLFLSTGENLLENLVRINEFDFRYDLISVDGDYVRFTAVTQQNVLFDDDRVTVTGDATGGATGDLAVAVTVVGGDNLAMNQALVSRIGADTVGRLDGALGDIASGLAAGKARFDAASAAALNGLGHVNALHVTGDLVVATVFEQSNVVGDADQIRLAISEAAAAAGMVHVSTGSNALLNAATMIENGVDSAIHVRGEIYSDALIHQAGLLDTDAMPTGVFAAPGLVPEAVAFLADGMIDAQGDQMHAAMGHAFDGMPGADVMQSVTS